jgi:hypothetical protein
MKKNINIAQLSTINKIQSIMIYLDKSCSYFLQSTLPLVLSARSSQYMMHKEKMMRLDKEVTELAQYVYLLSWGTTHY